MATYAGRYSENLQDRYGNGYRNALVAVETLAAAPVTLYADRDKTAYAPASGLEANEIKADSRGNLIFFADPGNYQIVVTPSGGSTLAAFPVSVLPDPLEPNASGDLAAHEADTANPHEVTKTQVGLSNVDNTSDANKPVSTDQEARIVLHEDADPAHDASQVSISDAGGYYTGTEVEAALQEAAAWQAWAPLRGPVATWVYSADPLNYSGTIAWPLANRGHYVRRATASKPISKIRIEIGVQSGNILVAAYAGGSAPTTLLASSGSVPCPAAGAADISLGSTVSPEWLMLTADNTTFSVQSSTPVAPQMTSSQGRAGYANLSFPAPSPAPSLIWTPGRAPLMIGLP